MQPCPHQKNTVCSGTENFLFRKIKPSSQSSHRERFVSLKNGRWKFFLLVPGCSSLLFRELNLRHFASYTKRWHNITYIGFALCMENFSHYMRKFPFKFSALSSRFGFYAGYFFFSSADDDSGDETTHMKKTFENYMGLRDFDETRKKKCNIEKIGKIPSSRTCIYPSEHSAYFNMKNASSIDRQNVENPFHVVAFRESCCTCRNSEKTYTHASSRRRCRLTVQTIRQFTCLPSLPSKQQQQHIFEHSNHTYTTEKTPNFHSAEQMQLQLNLPSHLIYEFALFRIFGERKRAGERERGRARDWTKTEFSLAELNWTQTTRCLFLHFQPRPPVPPAPSSSKPPQLVSFLQPPHKFASLLNIVCCSLLRARALSLHPILGCARFSILLCYSTTSHSFSRVGVRFEIDFIIIT